MSTWVYFAAEAQANEEDTIGFAMMQNVLWRSARDIRGNRIANVRNLRPGDTILLVYRQGRPHVARVVAKIAETARPVLGTAVIERIEPPHSQYLLDAGFRPVDNHNAVEVIQIEDVTKCEIVLHGAYPGQGAIHRLASEDANVVTLLPVPEDPAEQVVRVIEMPVAEPDRGNLPPAMIRTAVAPATDAPEVAAIRRPDTAGEPLFDAYVMVDWSSSSVPVQGANSIWVAWGSWEGGELIEGNANKATRAAAFGFIRDELLAGILANRRVLLGLDFAFGYPRGFATALGLAGPPWREVLEKFRIGVEDGPDNNHNRDAFAGECNAQIAERGPGPFWGCTRGAAGPSLTTCRVGVFDFPYAGLEEYRETDKRARRLGILPQSVWKLNQGVSVGGQTILGIKCLADLRFGGGVGPGDRMAIWPFETGWGVPGGADRVVLAEIFPSVLPFEHYLASMVRDLAQVRTCVREAADKDASGLLEAKFGAPPGLTDAQLAAVTSEEGWILFVP